MDNAALQAKLAAILDAFPAKSALHAVDLTTGEVIASLRAETRVVSASTIKVALLFCALEDVMAGKLALDTHISIAPEDFREDTRVFEPEYRQDGCSLWEMLYWMIVLSDNTATNAVISTLGYDHINAYCARLGLAKHRLPAQDARLDGGPGGAQQLHLRPRPVPPLRDALPRRNSRTKNCAPWRRTSSPACARSTNCSATFPTR